MRLKITRLFMKTIGNYKEKDTIDNNLKNYF